MKKIFVCVFLLATLGVYAQNLVPYAYKMEYALFNLETKKMGEARYDMVILHEGNFFLVKKDEKWGVLNRAGAIVLSAKFDKVEILLNKIIAAEKDGKVQLYNLKGVLINPEFFDSAECPLTVLSAIAVQKDEKEGLVDLSGKYIIPLKYASIRTYFAQVHFVQVSNENGESLTGLYDSAFKLILPVEYTSITYLKSNVYYAARSNGENILLENGKAIPVITPPKVQCYERTKDFLLIKDKIAKRSAVYTFSTKQMLWVDGYLEYHSGEKIFKVKEPVDGGRLLYLLTLQGKRIEKKGSFIGSFYHGYVSFYNDEHGIGQGLMDTNNNVIFPATYKKIHGWNDKICFFEEMDGSFGTIDIAKKKIIAKVNTEFKYPSFLPSTETVWASVNEKYALYNKKLERLNDKEYDRLIKASLLSDGSVVLTVEQGKSKFGNLSGCIDYYGNEIVPIGIVKVTFHQRFQDFGKAIATPDIFEVSRYDTLLKKSETLFFDAKGKPFVPKYSVIKPLKDERMAGRQKFLLISNLKENKRIYGVIDTNGNEIIAPEYDEIIEITSKYIVAKKDGYVALLDMQGNVIIPSQYDYINVLNDTLFLISKDNAQGVIDINGNIILPLAYRTISLCFNGVLLKVERSTDFIPAYATLQGEVYREDEKE
ncbi:MAG: WG repeat-containing protein [Flavobacteriales bacterium]